MTSTVSFSNTNQRVSLSDSNAPRILTDHRRKPELLAGLQGPPWCSRAAFTGSFPAAPWASHLLLLTTQSAPRLQGVPSPCVSKHYFSLSVKPFTSLRQYPRHRLHLLTLQDITSPCSFFKTSLTSSSRLFSLFFVPPSPVPASDHYYSIFTKYWRSISHYLNSHYTNLCYLHLLKYLPPNHYVIRRTTVANVYTCQWKHWSCPWILQGGMMCV